MEKVSQNEKRQKQLYTTVNKMKNILKTAILSFILTMMSCKSSSTSNYDSYSYQKTIEIKLASEKLLANSSQKYEIHKQAAENLLWEMNKIMEYEMNKPDNEVTTVMWQILSSKEKNLLAGYLELWKQKGTVSIAFKEEAIQQINKAFDLLLQFETKKDKESKSNLLDFITTNK